jgi:hypothetical protein
MKQDIWATKISEVIACSRDYESTIDNLHRLQQSYDALNQELSSQVFL